MVSVSNRARLTEEEFLNGKDTVCGSTFTEFGLVLL